MDDLHLAMSLVSVCVCVCVCVREREREREGGRESLSCVQLFCDLMDCSLPGSSVHGVLQARILVWVAIPFSGGSSQPRNLTRVSYIAGRFFTIWTTRRVQVVHQFSSVAQLCPTLCDPMNHSTPGLPVHHQLPESTQTHVHWGGA